MLLQLCPALGAIAFAIWGLEPLMRHSRNLFLHVCCILCFINPFLSMHPYVGLMLFIIISQQNDSNWKKSSAYHVSISYLRPLIFWGGAIFACRYIELDFLQSFFSWHPISPCYLLIYFQHSCSVFDQVALTSETSHVVKQRVLHFIRSLSTVLAFSYCLSRYSIFLMVPSSNFATLNKLILRLTIKFIIS